MIDEDFKRLSAKLKTRPPAEPKDITEFEAARGIKLPTDYVSFMLQSDGAEGPVGKNGYLNLWKIGELIELNQAYRAEEFAPGLLLFGSDGGDEAFAFDTRVSGLPIVETPFVGMSLEDAIPLASTFTELLEGGW